MCGRHTFVCLQVMRWERSFEESNIGMDAIVNTYL